MLKKTSNILHKSAFDAQVVDKFYSREPPGNSNMVIRAAFQNYFQSSSETDDDGNVDMRINVGDIWSNAKKQNVIGFHDYLIMQHTYLGGLNFQFINNNKSILYKVLDAITILSLSKKD